ncbi:acyl-lipid (8-3)-desaturase-like [Bradysia coprophila]|uniref:acyl-lipid (8-3)-desaturase-like n=1 Tax=Bradysia coprophila TaxID=38358 RepID=UPI00187D8665|nr:acyl-lipid (8-3)-desaturase-like [Bradysia coprophila]
MWYIVYVLLQWPHTFAKIAGTLLVAFSQGRTGWVAHECGHYSFSGSPQIDRFVHNFLHGTISGFSATWWKSGHNRHHAMPQRLNHDIDLDTVPLLAYNTKVVKKVDDGKGLFIKYQTYLFPVVTTLLGGLFWRWYSVPRFVIKHTLYAEIGVMLSHYVVYFYFLGFWGWFTTGWIPAIYVFLNFALSHTYLPVTTQPTHWVEYALVHTADVQ